MGIINLFEREESFHDMVDHRPVAAIPFGGRYRIIDFILSSMVNSGIKNVGIFTQNKHRSLFDHLRSGKDWDLDRKHDGLFIFPPEAIDKQSRWGDLIHLYQNLDYIYKSKQKYVLIAGGDTICNIDYRPVFHFHRESNADIAAIYKDVDDSYTNLDDCTIINKTENDRILAIEPGSGMSRGRRVLLDMYIMKKSLLIDLITDCIKKENYNFFKEGLLGALNNLHVVGFPYRGYYAKINSFMSYYQHSLDLLKLKTWQDLFYKPGLIYTKVKDEPPTKYINGSQATNVLVANGCIIEGEVEKSILFRGVKIDHGAVVKNSIIMQRTQIQSNALVQNVTTDKDVVITAGQRLMGETNVPIYLKKKTII